MAADTVLPRDRMVNVIHIDRPTGGFDASRIDADKLCADLAGIYNGIWLFTPGSHEIEVRLYNESIKGPPLGQAVLNKGLAPASPIPREVALCLSFKGGQGGPSQRGRVYLPMALALGGTGSVSTRPTPAMRDRAVAMATHFSSLGGIDIDWGVYSPRNDAFVKAHTAWCDDEWDTVRSRGMRSTTRKVIAVTG